MKEAGKNVIHSLQEEAKKSEDDEAFTVVTKIKNCRIGVGARLESPENIVFFVEVLVNLCTSHHPVNLDFVEKRLLLLRQLEERGYVLNCEEDGCISCELTIPSKNLIAECEVTSSIIKKYTE
jgi:hypothetical protein